MAIFPIRDAFYLCCLSAIIIVTVYNGDKIGAKAGVKLTYKLGTPVISSKEISCWQLQVIKWRKDDMKRGKTFISAALITALMGTMLAGCSKKEESPKQDTQAATAVSDKDTENQKKISLRFSWWGGDSRHEATLACIDAFMEENPNIEVVAEYGGFDGYQQKISASLAGGTQPDIMQLDQPWMENFSKQNPDFFLDLNQYTSQISIDGFSNDFLEDFCVYQNKLMCLPSGTNAINFLANKKVLDDAGVSFGDTITWDDLLEEGKKVNAHNPDHYMINLDDGSSFFITRIYLYQLTGKQLVNDDYTIGVSKGELEQAFAFTKKLYDEKVMIPYEEAMIFKGAPADNPKWNDNQLGGWFNWSSTANQQAWGENAITLPYPQIEGAANSGLLVRPSQVFAISNNCKEPEAAAKFLDFMLNQEKGVLALKDSRSIPANENARTLLQEKEMIYSVAAEAIELAMEKPGTPEANLTNNTEVLAVISNVMEKLIYNQYDAASAAEEAYKLLEDVLGNLKANEQ